MSKRTILIGVSAAALALGITAVQAAPKKDPTTHSAASLACSQQANAKGLHGKARKRFREHCKRQFKQGAGYKSEKSYNYRPQQDSKPMQSQGYKSQQGKGSNPQKWW